MGYGCLFSCLPDSLFFVCLFFCFFLNVSQSIRILLGLAAGSERTLPHVMKYQTVIPQRLKDTSLTSDAAATRVMPCWFVFVFLMLPPPFLNLRKGCTDLSPAICLGLFLCVFRHTPMFCSTLWQLRSKTTRCTWRRTSKGTWNVLYNSNSACRLICTNTTYSFLTCPFNWREKKISRSDIWLAITSLWLTTPSRGPKLPPLQILRYVSLHCFTMIQ